MLHELTLKKDVCTFSVSPENSTGAKGAGGFALVREIGDPLLAMCLDTGHANVCKAWQSPAGALRAHSDIVKVLHVHDNGGRRDEHLLPFCGTIDWADFSAALAEVKFAGALSLECAPSARLPAPLLEKAYAFYFQAAKSLATGDLNA